MICIYDRYDECHRECESCPREEKHACYCCGAQRDVIFYHGEYICSHCLAEQLIAVEDNIIFDFAERHSDLLAIYLNRYYSDERTSV